jgi:ribosomal protein S18 acetylase RimI-like enzyme
MVLAWQYLNNKSTPTDILYHLQQCDSNFIMELEQRIDLMTYADKLAQYAQCFEAWENGQLVGLVAIYCNDIQNHHAYITNVSTLTSWQGRGIARNLLNRACDYARESGMTHVQLEVAINNQIAIHLYQQRGFSLISESSNNGQILCLKL